MRWFLFLVVSSLLAAGCGSKCRDASDCHGGAQCISDRCVASDAGADGAVDAVIDRADTGDAPPSDADAAFDADYACLDWVGTFGQTSVAGICDDAGGSLGLVLEATLARTVPCELDMTLMSGGSAIAEGTIAVNDDGTFVVTVSSVTIDCHGNFAESGATVTLDCAGCVATLTRS